MHSICFTALWDNTNFIDKGAFYFARRSKHIKPLEGFKNTYKNNVSTIQTYTPKKNKLFSQRAHSVVMYK